MRFVTVIASFLALSTLAGCAAPSAVSRRGDTAVRAESRRISDAMHYADKVHDGPEVGHKALRAM